MNDLMVYLMIVLTGVLIGYPMGKYSGEYSEKYDAGYYECIETLPRNQDCKLIAVPEDGVVNWQDLPE